MAVFTLVGNRGFLDLAPAIFDVRSFPTEIVGPASTDTIGSYTIASPDTLNVGGQFTFQAVLLFDVANGGASGGVSPRVNGNIVQTVATPVAGSFASAPFDVVTGDVLDIFIDNLAGPALLVDARFVLQLKNTATQ